VSGLGEQGGGLFEPLTARAVVVLALSAALFLILSVVRVPTVRPDLAALVVVFLALEHELVPGLALSAAVGYLSDQFSGLGAGLDALTCVAVFLLLRLFVARIVGGRAVMVTVLSVVATGLALFVRQVVEMVVGPNEAGLASLAPALPSVVLGAVGLGYAVYRLFRWVDDRLRPREDFGLGLR
jgi:rod shape-determining protein MreD